MNPSKIILIYYSPTGTSKKILEGVANGLGGKGVQHINLTPFRMDLASKSHFIPMNRLAVFAVPVYGGRVPTVAAQRLKAVKGNGTPAVIVAVYGNRAFEDALIELRDIITGQGFTTVAGAAFIGEHSYSSALTPIAQGRPDAKDLAKAKKFGEEVKARIDALSKPLEITVPGNRPYKERKPADPRAPETVPGMCTLCGVCAEVCPTGSITVSDKVETVKETCTACSACVKACPTGARIWTNERIKKTAAWLSKEHSKRKEPEFFL
jgi:ferredoxin